jgi:membrane protease YdiL (CAAX protease family)
MYVVRKRTGLPAWPRPRVLVRNTLLSIPLVILAIVTAGIVTVVLQRLLGDPGGGSGPLDVMLATTNPIQWIFVYLLGVVAAPLGEEPFYRGMFFNALRQRIHWVLAALITSAVFALFHPFRLPERAGIFVLGLFMAGLYEWRKTLVAPMVFHALVNAFTLTVAFFTAAAIASSPMIGLAVEGRDDGCLIVQIAPGSGAEEAGIRVGDLIREMDVYSVREHQHIISIMQMHKVGDKIPVKYVRDGNDHTVDVTLKKRSK